MEHHRAQCRHAGQDHSRPREADITIYTIGVGYDDPTEAVGLADQRATPDRPAPAKPDNFFQDPTGEDLKGIYDEIWSEIDPCSGRHDWGKPWPPVIKH